MHRLSRLLAGSAVLLVLLGGCTAGPAGPEPAAQDPGFPVEVTHAFGTTEIPAAPQRVVALGVTDADTVLALGTTPVAAAGYGFYEDTGGLGPWARDRVSGALPEFVDGVDPSPERLAALTPDLIVAVNSGIDQAGYDSLSRIAPVVARPVGTEAYTVPRAAQVDVVAAALGRPTEGAELNRATDDAVAAARAAHPDFAGRTGAVVLPFEGVYGAFTDTDTRGQLLAELGFALPEPVATRDDGTSFYVELSAEESGLLDGDVLVMLADQPAVRAAVDADPVLNQVPVVADGRMIVADLDTRGALTYNSPLSVPYALERLVPALQDALG